MDRTEEGDTEYGVGLVVDERAIEVAVLDLQGRIVAVNDAWDRFASENGGSDATCGVGASYLEVCDAAASDQSAQQVGAAIRAALRGDLSAAKIVEIPCHSRDDQRWFDVVVSARIDEAGEPIGATVMLTAVADGQQRETAREPKPDAEPGTALASSAPLRPLSDTSEIEAWAMVESSPDGMILADEHGTMVLVNSQIESLFGYDRVDLLGKPVEQLLPEHLRQIHAAHRTRYRASPKPRVMGTGIDLMARRNDGTTFPVEVSLSPVTTSSGLRVVATVRDITDRLAAEAFNHAVHHSVDVARDGVFMFHPETLDFLYVNEGAVNQLGYSRDELLTMGPLHIKPEFTEAAFRDLLAEMAEADSSTMTFTTVHRRKDGRDVPVEIVLEYPSASGPNQTRMLVAIVRDITEREEAAAAVRASEAAFRTAFDAAPVGMATVDFSDPVRRPILACNQALADLLGYSVEHMLSTGFAELTYPDDSDESDAAAQQAASGTLPSYALEKRYIHADGHAIWVWVHSAVLPEADSAPSRVLVHVADLSDQRAARAERERSRLWLECLAEVRASLLSAAPIDQTLDLICHDAKRLIDADTAAILELQGDELRFIAFDSAESKDQLPATGDLDEAAMWVLGGETLVTSSVATDSRFGEENQRAVADASRVNSMIAAPVETGAQRLILLVTSAAEASFTDAEVAIIESFADETKTALELHEARKNQSRLDVLRDRERLAEDLHDRVIQRLFAAGMALQSVHSVTTDRAAAERISSTVDQLDQSIAELRSAIFRLNHPVAVAKREGLEAIIDRATASLGFEPTLSIEGDIEEVRDVVYEQLAPALTEALSNVARHADAANVEVSISCRGETLALTVADDGKGIDPNAAHGKGLANLESRAHRVSGTATLTNNVDGGTTLTWTAGAG